MIALTGARGLIGKYVSDRIPLPKRCLTRAEQASTPTCTWVTGDLSDQEVVRKFVQEAPRLIHLACSSNPRTSNHNSIGDIQQNLVTTVQLFEEYAKANPGGHIIFSSTGGNMYEADDTLQVTEGDLPQPRSCYSIHKLAAEHYLRFFCEEYGISGTILRISNPYGVILPSQRSQGIIGIAFAKLINGEELHILDSLQSVRDYLHLEDVYKAFLVSMEAPPLPGTCKTYNVSSGVGHSLEEVLSLIEKETQKKIRMQFKNSPKPTVSILSSEKIRNDLGWHPTIDLPSGIRQMWESFRISHAA